MAYLVRSSKGIQAMCNIAFNSKKTVLSEKVAAVGRKNVSSVDPEPSRTSSANDTSLAPRRVSMARRSVESSQESLNTTVHTQLHVLRGNNNPFKRIVEDDLETSSVSVFDQLDSSFYQPKKRGREEECTAAPVRKQMKLAFGGAGSQFSFTASQKKGKENGVTAFSLWLEENDTSMKSAFSGEADEFEKFCVGQYRMLSAAEKKEWKAKADETRANWEKRGDLCEFP